MVLRSTQFFFLFNIKRCEICLCIFKDLYFKRFSWWPVKPQLFVCHLVNPFIQTAFQCCECIPYSPSMTKYPFLFITLFKSTTLRDHWISTGFFFFSEVGFEPNNSTASEFNVELLWNYQGNRVFYKCLAQKWFQVRYYLENKKPFETLGLLLTEVVLALVDHIRNYSHFSWTARPTDNTVL